MSHEGIHAERCDKFSEKVKSQKYYNLLTQKQKKHVFGMLLEGHGRKLYIVHITMYTYTTATALS